MSVTQQKRVDGSLFINLFHRDLNKERKSMLAKPTQLSHSNKMKQFLSNKRSSEMLKTPKSITPKVKVKVDKHR